MDEDPRVPRPYLIGFDSECNDFKGDKLHYGKPDVHRATFIWTGAGVATYQRRHHHDQTTDVTGAPVRLPHQRVHPCLLTRCMPLLPIHTPPPLSLCKFKCRRACPNIGLAHCTLTLVPSRHPFVSLLPPCASPSHPRAPSLSSCCGRCASIDTRAPTRCWCMHVDVQEGRGQLPFWYHQRV